MVRPVHGQSVFPAVNLIDNVFHALLIGRAGDLFAAGGLHRLFDDRHAAVHLDQLGIIVGAGDVRLGDIPVQRSHVAGVVDRIGDQVAVFFQQGHALAVGHIVQEVIRGPDAFIGIGVGRPQRVDAAVHDAQVELQRIRRGGRLLGFVGSRGEQVAVDDRITVEHRGIEGAGECPDAAPGRGDALVGLVGIQGRIQETLAGDRQENGSGKAKESAESLHLGAH